MILQMELTVCAIVAQQQKQHYPFSCNASNIKQDWNSLAVFIALIPRQGPHLGPYLYLYFYSGMYVFCMIKKLLPIGGFFWAKEKVNFGVLKIKYLSRLIVKAISLCFKNSQHIFFGSFRLQFVKRKFCFDNFLNSFHAKLCYCN